VSEWKWEVIGVSNVIRLSSSFAPCTERFDESIFAVRPAATGLQQEDEMLEELDRRDRLRLVQFVCSFAWADFEIQPEERVFISRLIRRLDLDDEEDLQVQQWLDRPPALDDLDPTSIPPAHRRFFVEAIEGLISADGEIAEEERESFEIFKQLLAN
jgi:uncharacterized tellurite resistance protein B-like protein